MEVRIVFTSEVYIKGKNMSEVCRKWEDMPLFTADALENYACQQSVIAVEDAETYKDLMDEFNKA